MSDEFLSQTGAAGGAGNLGPLQFQNLPNVGTNPQDVVNPFLTNIGDHEAIRKITGREATLQQQAVLAGQQQLAALDRQTALVQRQAADLGPLVRREEDIGTRALARSEALNPIQAGLFQRELAGIRQDPLAQLGIGQTDPIQADLLQQELTAIGQGTAATPEQRRLIGRATNRALALGESDISRFSQTGLEQLREELSPSLGLRPGDTPITDRGFRLQGEATRQQGQLVRSLRGAQAEAELQFPLQAGAFQSGRIQSQQNLLSNQQQFQQGLGFQGLGFQAGRTQFQQNLAANAQAFQSQLRQQAFQNRLGATGNLNQTNLQLSSSPFIGGTAIGTGAGQPGTPQGGGGGVGSILSGLGGLATGAAGLKLAFSSKSFKENLTPLDLKKMLERTNNLNVERWNYKWSPESDKHIGPYAGDFKEQFGVGNGVTINLMDAVGVLFANVQQLTKEIEELKNAPRGSES